jgi:hypothetical protein
MRGTKAKLIRRIAADIAQANGIQRETQYDASVNSARLRTGTIVVSHCDRAIAKQITKVSSLSPNMPCRLLEFIAARAINVR